MSKHIVLVGKVYIYNSVESYIISIGNLLARVDKDTMKAVLRNNDIDGVSLSKKNRISTSSKLNTFNLSIDTANMINYASYKDIEELIDNKKINKDNLIKDIEIKERVQLLNKVQLETSTVENQRVVYLCRLIDSNRHILLNKASIVKLISANAIDKYTATIQKINGESAIYTDVEKVPIGRVLLADKTIYNIVGEVLYNNDKYQITRLVYDYFNRIANIEVTNRVTGESRTYDTVDYLKLRKFSHPSQASLKYNDREKEIIKYPDYLSDKNKTKLSTLDFDTAKKLLGNKAIKNDAILGSSGLDIAPLKDCIDIKNKILEDLSILKSGNSITLEIKDTDKVEVIGLGILSKAGNLSNYKDYTKSLVIIRVNNRYRVLTYQAFSKSVIQKINNIDIDNIPRYAIGESLSLSGYREYDMDTKVTKFFI